MTRLDHLLARNLACTRGDARALVDDGLVSTPDGTVLTNARQQVSAPLDVLVEGEPHRLHEAFHLLLNKPVGVITALQDMRHPTAYELLREAPLFDELRPVGRLDLDTTGLLLWTTDGPLLQRLTHPRRRIPRVYQAALARPHRPAPPDLILEDGHRPEIESLRPATELHPALARPADAATYAEITIIGGAYHEVRRIFAALGSHVLALCRVRFGQLALPPDLAAGAWRAFDPAQVWGSPD